jgi:hypothetical protein
LEGRVDAKGLSPVCAARGEAEHSSTLSSIAGYPGRRCPGHLGPSRPSEGQEAGPRSEYSPQAHQAGPHHFIRVSVSTPPRLVASFVVVLVRLTGCFSFQLCRHQCAHRSTPEIVGSGHTRDPRGAPPDNPIAGVDAKSAPSAKHTASRTSWLHTRKRVTMTCQSIFPEN